MSYFILATGLSRIRRATNSTTNSLNKPNVHHKDDDYEEDEKSEETDIEPKYQDYGSSCLSTSECSWPLICEEVEHEDGTMSNICNCDEK